MQAELWSISGLAIELGMDRRTIARKLEGLEPDQTTKSAKGKRTEKRWYMARVYRHLTKDDSPIDEKARLDRVRADRVEHDLSIARQEVAPVFLLERALARVCEQINSVLESIPLKVKKRVPKLPAREIENVRREIVKAQNAASGVTITASDLS